jgi:serine protease
MKLKIRWHSAFIILPAAILILLVAAELFTDPSASMAQQTISEATAAGQPLAVPTDQIIVKYRATADLAWANAADSAGRMAQLSGAAGVALAYARPMSGDAHVLRLPEALPQEEVEAIAARLERLPDVEYAEPDSRMFPTVLPDDPRYVEQWHYSGTYGIKAPGAWDITTGAPGVRIAVIDTGITDHADLAGRWVGGYDFISDLFVANDGNLRDPDPRDPGDWVNAGECGATTFIRSSWHGTHIAGTIGAKTNNGLGVAGINWVSQIVPVRVMGKCGGYLSDIVDGLRWAAKLPVPGVPENPYPAKVLNMSLGGPGECQTDYQNAINEVTAAGAIVVVSAGNGGSDFVGDDLDKDDFQPANCENVITVAAMTITGIRATYSNYGSTVEISAPGGDQLAGILSTLNAGTTTPQGDTYAAYSGTSMAAPHVSGVVSLMLSLNPSLTYKEVQTILRATARPFPSTCPGCGAGIVDAAAALQRSLPPVQYLPVVTAE